MKVKTAVILPLLVLMLTSISAIMPKRVFASDNCGGPYPHVPARVKAVSGPLAGEVTLYWDESAYANSYSVSYGQRAGHYEYGALNIGSSQTRSYTVKALSPGHKYYFAVTANRDCATSGYSGEVLALAGRGQSVESVGVLQTGGPMTVSTQKSANLKTQAGSHGLTARSGPSIGEVTLAWDAMANADNYHLVYGTGANHYEFGALNLGNTRSFTVRHLTAGKSYYFALVPVMGDRALFTTAPARAVAKGSTYSGYEVIQTKPENLVMPKEMPVLEVQVTPPPEAVGGMENTIPSVENTETPPSQVQGAMDTKDDYYPDGF